MKSRSWWAAVVAGLVWGLSQGAWSGPGPPSTPSSSPSASWSSPPSSSPSSPLQPEPHDHHSHHQEDCTDFSSRPPSPIPDTPLPVNVSLVIDSINSLDLTSAEISWHIILSWPDERLKNAHPICRHSRRWQPQFSYEYNFVRGKWGHFMLYGKDADKYRFYASILVTISASVDYVIHEFPYDRQEIYTKIDFSPYSFDEIMLQLETWHLKDQKKQGFDIAENPEWLVRNLSCYTGRGRSTHLTDQPFIVCRIFVQRKAGYYIINFVIPAGLICLLSIAGQFLHELRKGVESPPNKTQVAIAAVTSIGILSVAMGDAVPRQNGMTRLHYFYFTAIVLSISASIASTIRLGHIIHGFVFRHCGKKKRVRWKEMETKEEKESGELRWHWWVQFILFLLHLACLLSSLAIVIPPSDPS